MVSFFYSPSPEYPVACHRDDQPSPKATARQDGVANRAVAQRAKAGGSGAIPLDTPPLAAGSFIE